jgi:hypothetical protein
MRDQELQVVIKEIKECTYRCKTKSRNSYLDQSNKSRNIITRNNLALSFIENYILKGNKTNIILVWNGHSDKNILNRLDLHNSIIPNIEYNVL